MFDAIWPPSGASAGVVRRVGAVLPWVRVTSTPWRPRASRESRWGSRRSPIRPPMTEPSPLPASRETEAAASPTVVASLARIGRRGRGGGIASIAADAIPLTGRRGAGVAPAPVKAPLTSGASAPVRPRRRRPEVGAQRLIRRRVGPAADTARRQIADAARQVADAARVHPADLVQRGQRGGPEPADRRVGVRGQAPA